MKTTVTVTVTIGVIFIAVCRYFSPYMWECYVCKNWPEIGHPFQLLFLCFVVKLHIFLPQSNLCLRRGRLLEIQNPLNIAKIIMLLTEQYYNNSSSVELGLKTIY